MLHQLDEEKTRTCNVSTCNTRDMRAGLATEVGWSHDMTAVRLGSQIGGLGTWLTDARPDFDL